MSKRNTTSVKLDNSNKMIKLSSSPENLKVDLIKAVGCSVYVFTSDAITPAIPDTSSAIQLFENDGGQQFGDPFSVWTFIVSNGYTSSQIYANLTIHTWD